MIENLATISNRRNPSRYFRVGVNRAIPQSLCGLD